MTTLSRLKTIFKLRWAFGILAFILLSTREMPSLGLGIASLGIVALISDFRCQFYKRIDIISDADEDRPE